MKHKNTIHKLMKSGIPLLNRLENCLYLEVVPSGGLKGWYIASTYTSRYFEDNGEYLVKYDLVFYVNSTRRLRNELKRLYGGEYE